MRPYTESIKKRITKDAEAIPILFRKYGIPFTSFVPTSLEDDILPRVQISKDMTIDDFIQAIQ